MLLGITTIEYFLQFSINIHMFFTIVIHFTSLITHSPPFGICNNVICSTPKTFQASIFSRTGSILFALVREGKDAVLVLAWHIQYCVI